MAGELFVDTNVFLRFLTRDDDALAAASAELFERASAEEIQLWTTHLVIAELAWTLRSVYGLTRESIAATLGQLVGEPWLSIERRDLLAGVMQTYAGVNVDFIDAYNAGEVRRRGLERVCSYDPDFDRLDVDRLTPNEALAELAER